MYYASQGNILKILNQSLLILPLLASLAACGGGGDSDENDTSNEYRYPSLSDGTNGTAVKNEATGRYTVQSEKDFMVNCTDYCNISVTPTNATRSGASALVTGYTRYYVALKITDAAQAASATITATNPKDTRYTRTFDVDIVPSEPEALPVQINGNVATPNSNGEYAISSNSRITIEDANNRLGNTATGTVDVQGNKAQSSMNIHAIAAAKYDVTFTTVPVGGLTTITFSDFNPDVVIKLRWQ